MIRLETAQIAFRKLLPLNGKWLTTLMPLPRSKSVLRLTPIMSVLPSSTIVVVPKVKRDYSSELSIGFFYRQKWLKELLKGVKCLGRLLYSYDREVPHLLWTQGRWFLTRLFSASDKLHPPITSVTRPRGKIDKVRSSSSFWSHQQGSKKCSTIVMLQSAPLDAKTCRCCLFTRLFW